MMRVRPTLGPTTGGFLPDILKQAGFARTGFVGLLARRSVSSRGHRSWLPANAPPECLRHTSPPLHRGVIHDPVTRL